MDPRVINTMRNTSYLLPDPGGEVARELLDELESIQAELARVQAELAELRGER